MENTSRLYRMGCQSSNLYKGPNQVNQKKVKKVTNLTKNKEIW